MSAETWLPCPFCGGEPRLRVTQDEALASHDIVDWYEVGCPDCDIEARQEDEGDLRDWWNLRVPAADANAKVAILTEALDASAAQTRRAVADAARLRSALADLAEHECAYGDGCPAFGTRHGQCVGCKAREALKGGA